MSDDSDTAQWLTYREISDRRGISVRAVMRMVQRQGLRRQAGNDGKTRVLVPPDMLEPPRTGPRTDSAAAARDDLRVAMDALRGENAALRGQVEAMATLAATAQLQIDALTVRANRAEGEAKAALERLAAQEAADAAAKARGRLRRILAAWRGG